MPEDPHTGVRPEVVKHGRSAPQTLRGLVEPKDGAQATESLSMAEDSSRTYRDHVVAVVVPCFNERDRIGDVIRSIPAFVSRIYVVDDASTDGSDAIARATVEERPGVRVIRHESNRGVGAAIGTGYLACRDDGVDIAVVMAGDGQMDPADLTHLLDPIIDGEADYVKGNRFFGGPDADEIPRVRLLGNLVLSALTKIVSGYWHVSDTQCGYTAINRDALEAVDWSKIYPRYGCPNDILTRLNIAHMRVAEVKVKARYGADWTSKMRVRKVMLPILHLLWRLFLHRLYWKYIYMSGHPLIFYYAAAATMGLVSGLLFVYIVGKLLITGVIPQAALIMFGVAFGVVIQLLLGAFELDFQANRNLCIELRRMPGKRD